MGLDGRNTAGTSYLIPNAPASRSKPQSAKVRDKVSHQSARSRSPYFQSPKIAR